MKKMNILKCKILFLLLNVLFISAAYSQNNEAATNSPSLKKNVVYGTIGYGITIVANGNYERKLFESTEKKLINSIWWKVGYGVWVDFDLDDGSNITTGFTALTGSKKGHIELNFGFTHFLGEETTALFASSYQEYSLVGALGFRYQKPNGGFVFRTGIGYPDSLYLSFGFAF
jgi:hypothetical protein